MEKISKYYKKLSRKDKIRVVTASGCCLAIAGCATTFAFHGHNKYKESEAKNKIPNARNSKVIYDGKSYSVSYTYLLVLDEETHLCDRVFRRNSWYTIEKETRQGDTVIKTSKKIHEPCVFVDIKTGDEIAIDGYEDWAGYKKICLADHVNYDNFDEETKSSEISEEQYKELVKNDGKAKTLVKINK